MKRIVSLLLTAVIAVSCLTLSACHGLVAQEEFEIPSALTSEPIEITFWSKSDSNVTQVGVYQKAIRDFEALYPNIKVKLVPYNDYSHIYSDVITNISTNTTPNLCITYPDHIATYKTGGNTVVALDSLMSDGRYGLGGSELLFDGPTKDEIVPKFLDECILDGQYYALPYMRSTEACYVNRDLVEALGYELPEVLTWDFVFEVSEAAMAKNADGTYVANGQNTLIPFIYKSTDNMMITMLKQKDAGYSNDLGEIHIFNDTTEQILLDIAELAGQRAFSTFKISSYPGNYFNKGQCIFAIDSTAGATWIGTGSPNHDVDEDEMVEVTTEVMTVPQYDTDSPDMISQGPSVCIFNKEDPQEVLASWLFLQFLLTDEVQMSYAKTEGYCPVTLKAQSNPEYLEYLASAGIDSDEHYHVKIKATQLLIDNIDNTFVTSVFNGSTNLRSAAGQMIEEVTKGARRKDVIDSDYIEQVYAKVTSLYHLRAVNTDDKLPSTAVTLLVCLGLAWCGIGGYYLWDKYRK